MKHSRHSLPLVAALALAIAGCSNTDTGTASATTDGSSPSLQAVVEDAAAQLPAGDAPLQPGQTIQGTIEADVGNGNQSFRSLSTKMADDLDKQIAEKMDGNEKAQAAIDDANSKLKKLGTGTQVSSNDVKRIIGGMAGKTFNDSHVMHVAIIKQQTANIEGRAADGSRVQLSLSFDENSLALQNAKFSYQPEAKSVFDKYETDRKNPPEVVIERFEKNPDGSFALSGSFKTSNTPAAKIAKKLKGQTLASASGSFKFDALPEKVMPGSGG